MKQRVRSIALMLCLLVVAVMSFSRAATGGWSSKVAPRLERQIRGESGWQRVWVFFADKPGTSTAGKSGLSEKAIMRRAKNGFVIDERDWAINESYVKQCEMAGLRLRRVSRWLNAVSGIIQTNDVQKIAELQFVESIDMVEIRPLSRESSAEMRKLTAAEDPHVYGTSFHQLDQIRVPEVHDLGFFGQGVTIAVFDNGFRLLSHESLDSMNIVATWDFVDGKQSVVPVNPSPAFGTHGMNTLSVIGGYVPGTLIGPAFRSNFILARTENDSGETSFEEDNWIAALEWAESLGADVVSSSLSYLEMDAASPRNYDWTWMNGDSTLVTKAANLAVQRGMIVVNSAGNAGFNTSHNTLGGPADGDSVIAAGAVDAFGSRVFFSSVGPTTRGAIKPDVMARGVDVIAASGTSETGYVFVAGTSFSCPLTAGVCAQILSANPNLSSAQVRYALKKTASQSSAPDNLRGHGIIDALAASTLFGLSGTSMPAILPIRFDVTGNFPNPFNGLTTIKYLQPIEGRIRITIHNVLGQRVRRLLDVQQPPGRHSVQWDARDDRGVHVASGLYFYKFDGPGFSKTGKMIYLR